MKALNSLAALPISEIGRRPDMVLALMVAFIVSMLIVPMPNFLLDGLIAVNIAASLIVLLVALFAKNALEVSTFPSLLLITTLFRLGLNVSTTRGILSHADAGQVVKAFGQFVLQGDVVVGMIIFLIITLVQFLVIGKGAERVAEVGARFTLDAMPGKQMSIDAGVRSGAFTEEEGQVKRDELGRQSQLFGNMDGAMKFVKGDAIAGLIITGLNLVGGFLIGVVRSGMSAGDAAEVYSILTVGDGLVSQIAALLITLASGVLVTRVEAKDKEKNLGFSLKEEVLGNPKVLGIGAVLMVILGTIPGLPFLPFLLCALVVGTIAMSGHFLPMVANQKKPKTLTQVKHEQFKKNLERKVAEAKQQKSLADKMAPSVVPLGVDLDPELSRALGFDDEEADDDTELMSVYIPQLRDALYLETGVRFPGVRVRPHVKSMPKGTFMVRVNDVPVLTEQVPTEKLLATSNPENLKRIGVEAGTGKHPISRARMSLIDPADKAVVEAAGITVWNPAGIVALHVASVLRRKAKDFIGLQEVTDMITKMEKAYPALVKEVVPKICTVNQLVNVLRRLVEERVSIRDLKTILEAMGEHGTRDGDALFLTEKVRGALAAQLAHAHAGVSGRLSVLLLDPMIEDTIASAISHTAHGKILSLEPGICRSIINAIGRSLQPMVQQGIRPVVLTNSEVRRFVRKLIEVDLPTVAVLSFDELPADLTIQPMGRAAIGEDEDVAAAA
jgi:type III secretion protein V